MALCLDYRFFISFFSLKIKRHEVSSSIWFKRISFSDCSLLRCKYFHFKPKRDSISLSRLSVVLRIDTNKLRFRSILEEREVSLLLCYFFERFNFVCFCFHCHRNERNFSHTHTQKTLLLNCDARYLMFKK